MCDLIFFIFINKTMKIEIKSVLFLGVGGISMHQLALAFKKMGLNVFGYDSKITQYTKLCENAGIKFTNKFKKSFLDVDLCVKTAAIKEDNKFLKEVIKKNIKVIDRAEALSWLMKKFKNVIAVAGTHGKTTTATLIYEMLKTKFEKVSCHIGADIKNSRFELGDDFLVVEACEYNKSFLKLYPNVTVVTNVEPEHLDSYGNFFNLKLSFVKFFKRGELRFVGDDKSNTFLKKYGAIVGSHTELNLNPKLKGEYNFKNINLAISVSRKFGVDDEKILNVVNSFSGVGRRFQNIGKFNDADIYIDYAHHPTEVKCFIETFVKFNPNSQIIFQPHTYSRTKYFLKEFVDILSKVDNLIIFKEYPAREKKKSGVSAKQLYEKIQRINPTIKYCATIKGLTKKMKNVDNYAFVGAGDINLIAQTLIKVGCDGCKLNDWIIWFLC